MTVFCLVGSLSVALVLADSSFKRQRHSFLAAWKQIGPEGGDILGLAENLQYRNELFAVTNTYPAQVFKSPDAAGTWEKISSLNANVFDIVLDPLNPATLYLLSSSGIYKSTNGGLAWIQYSFGGSTFAVGGQLISHSVNPEILYAVGYSYDSGRYYIAVHKSSNGGQTWTSRRLSEQADSAYGYSIALSPAGPNMIYASGYYRKGSSYYYKIYKSTDGGESWSDASGGMPGPAYDLAVDANNSSKVYAGTTWGVYRSSDAGLTWIKNTGIAYAYALGIDPANSNILYAGYTDRCFKSVDGGISWTEVSGGAKGTCRRVVVISNQVFYASNVGIYKSANGGASWDESQTGIYAAKIPSLATAASSPNLVFAEVAGNGFFKSADCGTTWQRLPDFYRCDSITRISVDPADASDIFILAGG